MSEIPNEEMDEETRERLYDAWKGLSSGFVAYAKRTNSPFNRAFLVFAVSIPSDSDKLAKANVFSTFMSEIDALPINLQLLLIRDNVVILANGAQLEWQADQPSVLNTFNFQTSGLKLTNERIIGLINTVGSTLEQPHNTL